MVNIKTNGWYRDGHDILWLDAQLMSDGNWMLYRGGAGPREYTPTGQFIVEWVKGTRMEPTVPSDNRMDNLSVEVEHASP